MTDQVLTLELKLLLLVVDLYRYLTTVDLKGIRITHECRTYNRVDLSTQLQSH